jgi:hypothetical protein
MMTRSWFAATALALALVAGLGCRGIAGYGQAAMDAGTVDTGRADAADVGTRPDRGPDDGSRDLASDASSDIAPADAPPTLEAGTPPDSLLPDTAAPLDTTSTPDSAVPPTVAPGLFVGESGHFKARAVATAKLKTVNYVAYVGSLVGTIKPNGSCAPLTNSSQDAAAVLVYTRSNTTLTCIWAKAFSPAANGVARFDAATIDTKNQRLVVAGYTSNTITVGTTPLSTMGGQDALVAGFNLLTGAHHYSATWGGTGTEAATGVAIEPLTNDIIVVGSLTSTTQLGLSSLTPPVVNLKKGFVARLAQNGALPIWAKLVTTSAEADGAAGVVVYDGIWIVGRSAHPLTPFRDDVLLAHLLLNGQREWVDRYGTKDAADVGTSIAVDPASKKLVIGGYSYGDLDFEGLKAPKVAGRGEVNGFALLAQTGPKAPTMEKIYRTQGDATSTQRVYAVAIDNNKQPVLCGQFKGQLLETTAPPSGPWAQGTADGFCLHLGTSMQLIKSVLVSGAGDTTVHGAALTSDSNADRFVAVAGTQSGLEVLAATTITKGKVRLAGGHPMSHPGTITSVVADPSGQAVFISGYLRGGFNTHYGRGGEEGFITRYGVSATGLTHSWTATLSGQGDDRIYGMAVTGSSLYVVGSFSRSSPATEPTTFGTAGSKIPLIPKTSAGTDAFVGRLNTNTGAAIWVTVLGSGGTLGGKARAVVVAGTSLVVSRTIDKFGGLKDIALTWLDTNGVLLGSEWKLSGQDKILLGGMVIGANGQPLVVGSFSGTVDFKVPGQAGTTNAATRSGFAVSFSTPGTPKWLHVIDGSGVIPTAGLLSKSGKDVHVAGYFDKSLTLDGTLYNTSGGGPDGFVVTLDGSGKLVKGRHRVLAGDDVTINAAARSPSGELVLLGSYQGSFVSGILPKATGRHAFAFAVDLAASADRWAIPFGQSTPPVALSAASYVGQRLITGGSGQRTSAWVSEQPWIVVLE